MNINELLIDSPYASNRVKALAARAERDWNGFLVHDGMVDGPVFTAPVSGAYRIYASCYPLQRDSVLRIPSYREKIGSITLSNHNGKLATRWIGQACFHKKYSLHKGDTLKALAIHSEFFQFRVFGVSKRKYNKFNRETPW